MVIKYKELILKMSEELLERETLDLNDIIRILGKRPFKSKSSFEAYLENTIEKAPA